MCAEAEQVYMPLGTLRELLDFHYDRRERLYRRVAGLTPEEFVRPMGVGWSDIRGTLVHCLRAEEFWVQHGILGRDRPRHDPANYPDVASLAQLAQQVRGRTDSFLSSLTESDLLREHSVVLSSGDTVRFAVGRALIHVIAHDAHHRGEVVAMLRIMGHEPPPLDFLA